MRNLCGFTCVFFLKVFFFLFFFDRENGMCYQYWPDSFQSIQSSSFFLCSSLISSFVRSIVFLSLSSLLSIDWISSSFAYGATESMVIFTFCGWDCNGADSSVSIEFDETDVGASLDAVCVSCALNVTVSVSVSRNIVFSCSMSGCALLLDGSGLVNIIRAPDATLCHGNIYGKHFE